MTKITKCSYAIPKEATDCCPLLSEISPGVFTWDRGDGTPVVTIDTTVGGSGSNLSPDTPTANTAPILNDNGTGVSLALATTTLAGLASAQHIQDITDSIQDIVDILQILGASDGDTNLAYTSVNVVGVNDDLETAISKLDAAISNAPVSEMTQSNTDGSLTHDPGDGGTPVIFPITSPDADNITTFDANGVPKITCAAINDCVTEKSYEFPVIQELWDGTQTAITIPAPADGTIVKYTLIANSARQAYNDGTLDLTAIDDFAFQSVENADGSVTITPDKAWGESDFNCVMIVDYVIEVVD